MKRTVFILIVLALAAPVVLAHTDPDPPVPNRFYPNRDNGNNYNDGEVPNNRGKVAWIRGAKGQWGETYYCDFDTDAIQAWMDANPLGVDEQYVWTFSIQPNGSWPNDNDPAGYEAEVWTLNLQNDWAEGDGMDAFSAYNWTPGTLAATDFYAQHSWKLVGGLPADDVANCVPWVDQEGNTHGRYIYSNELHKIQNSENFWANYEYYTDGYTRASVVLDEAVWQDLMTNEFNRGLALNGTTGWQNSTIYSTDQDNANQEPYIEITIEPIPQPLPWPGDTNDDDKVDGADYTVWADGTNVPEPATLLLVLVGAGVAIRRKR